MSELRTVHERAMAFVDAALAARRRGDQDEAQHFFRQAFDFEARAAAMVADDLTREPARSVLHRSAATLALDCGEYREAKRLAAAGLAGHPPEEIADELRDVLEQANRHLLTTPALTVTLSGQTARKLRAVAERKGVGPSALVRAWVAERLDEAQDDTPARKSA